MIKAELRYREVSSVLMRRGISLRELSNQIEVTPGYCSQLMRGKRCASPRVRQKLMEALGLDFDTLFNVIDNTPTD